MVYTIATAPFLISSSILSGRRGTITKPPPLQFLTSPIETSIPERKSKSHLDLVAFSWDGSQDWPFIIHALNHQICVEDVTNGLIYFRNHTLWNTGKLLYHCHSECVIYWGDGKWQVFPQSCLILCDPMDGSRPGFSVHGVLQARILEWVAMPSSRGSSWPRDWTHISCISCIGRWALYHWTTWEDDGPINLDVTVQTTFKGGLRRTDRSAGEEDSGGESFVKTEGVQKSPGRHETWKLNHVKSDRY